VEGNVALMLIDIAEAVGLTLDEKTVALGPLVDLV
jgi:hypothetical protein